MDQLTEHLHWIQDTCSAYVIQSGDGGLLIDCGSLGPKTLDATGIQRIELLLLTHYHRDQCEAAAAWQQQGTEVGLPFTERRCFEEADLLRASYDIYDNYTSYYPCAGPLHDLRGRYVQDYEALSWQGLRIDVIPLPGHTFGSVGYLLEVDGQRVLACGDLMAGPGKLKEYFWSQWRYMDFQGHVNYLESLERLSGLDVDLILPGHGRPFAATREAIGPLQQAMEELWELFYGRPYEYYRPDFRQLSPHVFEVTNSAANTYIVRDDEGHAILIDCGYTSNSPISANPHRFIDQLTPSLEPELGIHTVEWFLPSHYHDDHLAGLPALQVRYGTKVVSSPELEDILEHPERFDMPCLVPQGVKVDQLVQRGQAFEWRGIKFYIEQHPGQTLYHQLIAFEVDGQKFLSIGDNISGLCFAEQRDYIHSFIPKNRTPVSSYPDMPQQILRHAPDWLLTGHGGAVKCERDKIERWQKWMDRWQELFTGIIDQPHPDMGMDPRWIEFYPYKVRIRPGEEVLFEVRVTNHETQSRKCSLSFRSVEGVELQPANIDVDVQERGVATCKLRARFPTSFKTHSLAVVADVTWNGQHLGEVAEAVAYW